jgi:hypothetical protein
MAAAIDAAFQNPEFERRVRLVVDRPEPPPVKPAVAAAWASFDQRQINKLVRQIGAITRTNEVEGAEAIQNAFLGLLEKRPELFTEDPATILGLVSNYARKLVAKQREVSPAFHCMSLDMSNDPKSAADPEREGTVTMGEMKPAVAYTRAGVDEDAHLTPPPKRGELWTRLQLIGAVQRFRNAFGRAPKRLEFGSHGLPPTKNIKRLGFSGLNDLLREAGVPVEAPDRMKSSWGPIDSSEACLSFRRREGLWPSNEDARRLPAGTLPPYNAMVRYFGGASSLDVQLGVEAILGPIDAPKWKPDGSLTARLRGTDQAMPPPDDFGPGCA